MASIPQQKYRPILLVSSLGFGGAEVQTAVEANLLARKGHFPLLIAFGDGPVKERLDPQVGVRIISEQGYWSRAKAVAKLCRKHQATHIHCVLFAAKIVGAIAGMVAKVPVIWHVHGHRFYDSKKVKAFLQLTSRLPSVKSILFVANAIRKWHEKEGYYPKSKVGTLYNGLEPPAQVPNLVAPDVFTIGFIGRFVALKRVELLLESLAALKAQGISAKAIIVGDGEEGPRWKQLSSDLGLDQDVEWTGFVQNPRAEYARFSCVVLPSSEEAMSLTLLDALREGVPAIAFNVGGNGEIIVDGQTGFLVTTPQELTERLAQLAGGFKLAGLGQAGLDYFIANFTEESHYQTLIAFYQKALRKN